MPRWVKPITHIRDRREEQVVERDMIPPRNPKQPMQRAWRNAVLPKPHIQVIGSDGADFSHAPKSAGGTKKG
jgi:hypothetical protein